MATPGLTQTALDIITSSMRLLNAASSGETISAEEASDGLSALNQMIDAWQIDRLMIFTERIDDFPFVSGKQTYTLGDGGDFNIPRPAKVDLVSTVILSNPTNPLELSMEYTDLEQEWQEILLKNISTSFPQFCYDDGQFPLRNLNFWPVPIDADKARIYSWQQVQQFADLSTAYSFPPGYLKAIRFNLAVDLAPEYGGLKDPTVPQLAQAALQKIKAANTEIPKLKCDDAVCGGAATGPNYRAEWFNIP
jgi:hypothetical protein